MPFHQFHSSETLIDQQEVPAPFWKYSDLSHHDDHQQLCAGTLCAICGLHITVAACNAQWRHDAVVVGDLEREYEFVQSNREYPSICQEPVVFSARIELDCCTVSKGCSFTLSNSTDNCFVYAADTDSFNGGPDGENTIYIPMHRSCFRVALKAPAWDQAATSPLRALFRVLRHRFQVNLMQLLRRFPPPHDEDFMYRHALLRMDQTCVNTSGFQSTEGIERGYFSHTCFSEENAVAGEHYLAHDPLDIPALTSTLLENLEPRVHCERTDGISQFREHFKGLPNELKLLIFDYVVEAQDWPLQCTRLLGPRFWKSILNKNNPCFAWLWDLDQKMIRRTDPDLEMDWELLFRKLSQGPKIADCFGGNSEPEFEIFRGILKKIPPGLEGRRRIWKLLEEMYIGDRSTRWELRLDDFLPASTYQDLGDVEETPVYWERNGERLEEEKLRAI